MNKIIIVFFISFAPVLLSGCSTKANMDRIMLSWIGVHIENVVRQWGYPDREQDFRGRKLYIWEDETLYAQPTTSTVTGNVQGSTVFGTTVTTGGMIVNGRCARTLEVDQQGFVVNWHWDGNDCPSVILLNSEYESWPNRDRMQTGGNRQ